MTQSILKRITIILICTNFFYINAVFNYKVLFILGLFFVIKRRMSIKWLIAICAFIASQILLIWLTSSDPLDRVFVLITTFLVGVGYLGWVSLLFKMRAYEIPLMGYMLVLAAGYLLRSSFVNIDPLILALLATVSLHEKTVHSNSGLSELFIFLTGFIYSVLSGWRSAVLGFMVGFSYSIYLNSKLIPRLLLLILGAILVSYALSYALNILELLMATGAGADPSSGRLAITHSTLSVIYQLFMNFDIRAYFGHGIGAFSEDFAQTMSIVVDVLDVEITSLYEAEGKSRLHAHNFIIQNLYEFGLIGLIIQATLIFKMLNTLNKYRVFIYIGCVSGSLSGIFYIYSEYFIVLYVLYMFSKTKNLRLNASI